MELAKTVGVFFAGLGLAAAAVACDARDIGSYCEKPGQCSGSDATGGTGGRRDATPPDSVTADSGPSRSPLCGTVGCFPGNISACVAAPLPDRVIRLAWLDDATLTSDAQADGATPSDASVSDAPGSTDANGDECHDGGSDADDGAGADGSSDDVEDATIDIADDTASDGGSIEDAGESDGGGSGAVDSSIADARLDIGSNDEPRIAQSCYIRPASTGVITECAPVGAGAVGSACTDSLQCGVLMACVESSGTSSCQRVWCALPATCILGTFYQELPLRVVTGTRKDILVPVCLPTENCTLLSPQSCPAGKSCAVVGNDGETACIEPGTATVGESCSETQRCADGLLCSKFSGQCVKICHVSMGETECPTGTCQGGNLSLPDGFGICVGQTPDGG